MFLLLRIALVIGLIVYLSPARRASETRLAGSPDIESVQRLMGLAAPALERAGELSRLWGVLPEAAREQAIRNLANELRGGAARNPAPGAPRP
jgi:hypothetical protein